MYDAGQTTEMTISLVPGQTPATLMQVMAWWPSAYPGHSKWNPGAEWADRYDSAALQVSADARAGAAGAVLRVFNALATACCWARGAVVGAEAGWAAGATVVGGAVVGGVVVVGAAVVVVGATVVVVTAGLAGDVVAGAGWDTATRSSVPAPEWALMAESTAATPTADPRDRATAMTSRRVRLGPETARRRSWPVDQDMHGWSAGQAVT